MGWCRVRCGRACLVLRSLRARRQPLKTKPTSGGDGRQLALAKLREVAQRVPSDHRGRQAWRACLLRLIEAAGHHINISEAWVRPEFAPLARGNYCVCATYLASTRVIEEEPGNDSTHLSNESRRASCSSLRSSFEFHLLQEEKKCRSANWDAAIWKSRPSGSAAWE